MAVLAECRVCERTATPVRTFTVRVHGLVVPFERHKRFAVHSALDALTKQSGNTTAMSNNSVQKRLAQTELPMGQCPATDNLHWLDRLDTGEPLERPATNTHKSGRKRKHSEKEYKEFEETVHEPPVEVGIGATA